MIDLACCSPLRLAALETAAFPVWGMTEEKGKGEASRRIPERRAGSAVPGSRHSVAARIARDGVSSGIRIEGSGQERAAHLEIAIFRLPRLQLTGLLLLRNRWLRRLPRCRRCLCGLLDSEEFESGHLVPAKDPLALDASPILGRDLGYEYGSSSL